MKSIVLETIIVAVVAILQPLVRILLRNGVSFGTFSDIAKWVYVDTAANEFGPADRKQTVSRISVITGLSRKEVTRVKERKCTTCDPRAERYNRAVRVISAWRREPPFTDSEGRPVILPINGKGATFAELARRFSGDLPCRAILDELLAAGCVEIDEEDRVCLLNAAYLANNADPVNIHIMGADTASLIETIEHNLQADETQRFFQRKVLYDNLPEEVLPSFRALTANAAQQLLEHLDGWLAGQDRDTNPDIRGTGRNRAGLGIYYIQQPFIEKNE